MLKQSIIESISEDAALQGVIAVAAGVDIQTPKLWIYKKRTTKFLDIRVLEAIRKYCNADSVNDLLTEKVAV